MHCFVGSTPTQNEIATNGFVPGVYDLHLTRTINLKGARLTTAKGGCHVTIQEPHLADPVLLCVIPGIVQHFLIGVPLTVICLSLGRLYREVRSMASGT